MKKILGALLMLSMAIGGTAIATNTTKDVQAATTIKSNKWYQGMTDGEKAKVYTYKMQGSGYFYYELVADEDGYYYYGNYQANDSYFVNTSMSQNYKQYENTNTWSTSGGFVSSNYAFKAGDNVKIKVYDIKGRQAHYRLKVTFVKTKNFEKENNNSRSKANTIKKGVTYTGLAMKDDTDWFVFKAPKTKKYKIRAVCTNEKGCYQSVDIYKGYKRMKSLYMYSGDGWNTLFSGKLKKGEKVYVKISGGGDDEMYKIKAQ